ncbi:unnamed protein product [Moneuplotes crassus]|uniref:Phosphatidylserine synthase n=1 Tax=Euplotes crassus TaxID=5936 RepID=A0AAD1UA89_EUPCR|nr:unnamed protein product [Moneuplotes crassus]
MFKSKIKMPKKDKQQSAYTKREVGMQSIVPPKLYDSPHILRLKNLETVEYNKYFYVSHTLTFLGLGVIALNVLIYYTRGWPVEDLKILGLKGAMFFFLMFSCFYMPDTIVTRPHPFIWRGVLGANLLYLGFLTYISILPLDEARKTFKIFDETLGETLPERSYAEDCRIYTPEDPVSAFRNFRDSFFDVHTFAHLLGWICKVLIIRDIKVCWICSIGFEIAELTLNHWLPNFKECWWDHLILDLFGANLLGMVIGSYILKYYSVNKINWIYEKDHKSAQMRYLNQCSSIKRAVLKLQPNFFMQHDWKVFKSLKRFYTVIGYCAMGLMIDCNNFFMKTVLLVPPNHYLLKLRLLLWCPLILAASEELFDYVTNKYSKRVRPHLWLTILMLCMEAGISIRDSDVYTGKPFPFYIKVFWTIMLVLFICISIWIYTNEKKEDDDEEWNPYDPKIDIKEIK